MSSIATVILAGGKGERLRPLTEGCAKPAVAFGVEGALRLIDIPILTALEALSPNIFVLTQYQSPSIKNHIDLFYPFPSIEVVCGKASNLNFSGTADAVRKIADRLERTCADEILILPGDQVHDFNVRAFLNFARNKKANCALAATKAPRTEAARLGILKVDPMGRAECFVEKPTDQKVIERLVSPSGDLLGSMGIYYFKKRALLHLLKAHTGTDFGSELIPHQIQQGELFTFMHEGIWEDIGTIATFYKTSLDLVKAHAGTYIAPSARVTQSHIEGSLIGPAAHIGPGSRLIECVHLGSGVVGIDCHIRRAIIDINTKIGDGVTLINSSGKRSFENDLISVKEGIIVVKQGAHLPSGYSF
jgi:glucose-1-phosphate adenylyltransferase